MDSFTLIKGNVHIALLTLTHRSFSLMLWPRDMVELIDANLEDSFLVLTA